MELLIKIIRKFKREGFLTALKDIFWKLKFEVNKFFSSKVVKSRYGIKLVSNYEDETFSFYHNAGYGFDLSNILKNFHDEFYFIDIGANQGLYSIIASKNVFCLKSIAFEPVPETFDLLQKNVFLNQCEKKCLCIKKGISNKEGIEQLSFAPNHTGSASLVRNISAKKEYLVDIELINHVELNHVLKDFKKKIFLKIDVEGFELIVLQEFFKTEASNFIDYVFYEVDNRWVNNDDIQGLLKTHNFQFFKKIGKGNSHYDVLAAK